jgi:pimeloyl-ACP methyl ester carboxylesterase
MTHKHIVGPAGALHVDDDGVGGVPVLFVHSFGGSTAHWLAQLDWLRKSRRALALDLRGHGQSSRPLRDDYAVESFAKDIAVVADSFGLMRFVLAGHSLGGAAAIAYAGRHPERIAGLLLVGARGKVPEGQARQIMNALESDYERVIEDYWNGLLTGAQPRVEKQIRSEMKSMPHEPALRIIRAIFEFNPLPALNVYRGPKMAIVTPNGDSSNDLHHLVPGLAHKLITGTSHWPHMDKPEEFNQMMDEFLASVVGVDQHGACRETGSSGTGDIRSFRPTFNGSRAAWGDNRWSGYSDKKIQSSPRGDGIMTPRWAGERS